MAKLNNLGTQNGRNQQIHGLAMAARKAQAEAMVANGTMPSLDEVLKAVAETREKFLPKILKAREEDEKQAKLF
jgi:hypothetical protein